MTELQAGILAGFFVGIPMGFALGYLIAREWAVWDLNPRSTSSINEFKEGEQDAN